MAGVYDTLSRTQKLATFLIVIGPEAAAHVLRQFEDEEIELLCREMTSIRAIDEEDQKRAIEEFSGVIYRVTDLCSAARSILGRLWKSPRGISRLTAF